jgi:hypothetical protein
VRQEDAGGREAGAPLDLKMPLENGRADERVSRGHASERAVCVCDTVGQDRLGPSYFFIPLVIGPLNSLVWYVPSLRYTRGLGWRMHFGVEVTESSTNKQHHLSPETLNPKSRFSAACGGAPFRLLTLLKRNPKS